jgi:hypothetical protein
MTINSNIREDKDSDNDDSEPTDAEIDENLIFKYLVQ